MSTFTTAAREAKQLSMRYGVWYVRKLPNGKFAAYAHSSDDEQTVACYISGKLFDETQEQENIRRQNWIDRNGSDAGFDPYAGCE